MKIIVAGSREFTDWNLLKNTLARLTRKIKRVEVVSGHAAGADRLGERWCLEIAPKLFGYGNAQLTIVHQDREKYGKGRIAFEQQADEMIGRADALVLFAESDLDEPLEYLADQAHAKGLKVKIVLQEDW